MPGLVPGIHVFAPLKSWMAGSSPAMTHRGIIPAQTPQYPSSTALHA
jgi:hypothetical protein